MEKCIFFDKKNQKKWEKMAHFPISRTADSRVSNELYAWKKYM